MESDVAEKVGQIVATGTIKKKDYPSASAIHTGLVNSVWKEHKDWLIGIKLLIQMSAKTVQSSKNQDQWAIQVVDVLHLKNRSGLNDQSLIEFNLNYCGPIQMSNRQMSNRTTPTYIT